MAEKMQGQHGFNLGNPGVRLGSTTLGQPGVNLGSTWGQPGVNLHRPTQHFPFGLLNIQMSILAVGAQVEVESKV